MKEIVMATNNAGKVKEMQALFDELSIKVYALINDACWRLFSTFAPNIQASVENPTTTAGI